MTPVIRTLPYIGRNLLFLEEVLDELATLRIEGPFLFRASEKDKLSLLLAHGTDRAGFPGARSWTDGPDLGRPILHEDVIFATTAEEIRGGEGEVERSTSLKKFAIIEDPLLAVLDARCFGKLCDRQYEYLRPTEKMSALLALFLVHRVDPIQGWFCEDDGLALRNLVRSVHGGTVVEVGCWQGLSTAYIGRMVARQGSTLCCVDDWRGSSDEYAESYRQVLADQDVSAAFAATVAALGIEPQVLRMQSTEAARSFAEGSLDLVFIDASHDRAAVSADLSAWWPKMKPGGVLAGHDFNAEHAGVRDAVTEFVTKVRKNFDVTGRSVWSVRR